MFIDCVSFRSALLAALVAALICFIVSASYRWLRTKNDVLQTDLYEGLERGHIDIPSLKIDKAAYFDKSCPASVSILQHNRFEHVFSYKYQVELISFRSTESEKCDIYLPDGIGDASEKTTLYSELNRDMFSEPIVIDDAAFHQDHVVKSVGNTSVLKAKPFDMTEDELILGLTKTGIYKIRIITQVLYPNRRKTTKDIDVIYVNGSYLDYKEQIRNLDLVSYLFDDE